MGYARRGMEPVGAIGEFLAHPIGRYVAGESYIVWAHSPTLIGNAYFGRPDERDLADHRRMFELPAHAELQAPFDVILDASLLERADSASYELLIWYVRHKLPRFEPLVRRMVLIPPDRYVGAFVLGIFLQVIAPRFAARICVDRAAAFDWLDRAGGVEERAALDRMYDDVIGQPALVHRVRAFLAADATLRVDQVARMSATSERTLQRELSRAGTSFRAEVARARLRHAEALLRDTPLKLEAVARRLGYSSLAHFSDRFRRWRGVTPSEFRRRGA